VIQKHQDEAERERRLSPPVLAALFGRGFAEHVRCDNDNAVPISRMVSTREAWRIVNGVRLDGITVRGRFELCLLRSLRVARRPVRALDLLAAAHVDVSSRYFLGGRWWA